MPPKNFEVTPQLKQGFKTVAPPVGTPSGTAQAPPSLFPEDQAGERFPIGATIGSVGAGFVAGVLTRNPAAIESAASGGAFVGDFVQSGAEAALGLSTAPKSLGAAFESASKEAALSLAFGAGFRGAAAGIRSAKIPLKFFANSVTPEARSAINFFNKVGAKYDAPAKPPGFVKRGLGITEPSIKRPSSGFMLTAPEATENTTLSVLNNFGEFAVFGSGFFRKFKVARGKILENLQEEMVESLGPKISRNSLTAMVKNLTSKNKDIARIPAKIIYNTIGDIYNKAGVKASLLGMQEFARPISETGKRLKGIGKSETAQSIADDLLAIGESLPNLGPSIPVGDLIQMRTALMSMSDKMSKVLGGGKAPAIGAIRQLTQLADTSIKEALKRAPSGVTTQAALGKAFAKGKGFAEKKVLGKAFIDAKSADVLDLWEQANTMWRNSSDTFANGVLKKLIRRTDADVGKPTAIINAIFDDVGDPVRISKIRDALTTQKDLDLIARGLRTTPKAFERVQRGGIEKLLVDSMKDGIVMGQRLEENLLRFADARIVKQLKPGNVLEKIFGKEVANNLLEYANAVKIIQAKQPVSTGGMAIQLTQGGALVAAFSGTAFTKEAATIFIGPSLIATALLSPKLGNALINGTKLSIGSPQVASLVGRLVAGLLPEKQQQRNQIQFSR